MFGSISLSQQAGLAQVVQQEKPHQGPEPSSFTWTRHRDGVPSHCLSCTDTQQLSQAPHSAAFSSSMWRPRTSPSSKGERQPGGNVPWVTGMAPAGCSFSHLSYSACARAAYPGDKWQWRGSSGICSSAVGFLFCILLFFGMSQWQMCQADGSWLGDPSWPQGRQGWGRTKLLSIKDEPLILLFTLLLPLAFSNCL